MSTYIPSSDPIVYVKVAGTLDSTYIPVYCPSDWSETNSSDVAQEKSLYCPPNASPSPSVFTYSFNAFNDSSANGTTAASAKTFIDWQNTRTRLSIKISDPGTGSAAGNTFYREGDVYVAKVTESAKYGASLVYAVDLTGASTLVTVAS